MMHTAAVREPGTPTQRLCWWLLVLKPGQLMEFDLHELGFRTRKQAFNAVHKLNETQAINCVKTRYKTINTGPLKMGVIRKA